MHLVVMVVSCVENCPDVLEAWEKAGVSGVTIIESIGMRHLQNIIREDLPLMPSLRDLVSNEELAYRTLFSVVPDEDTVDRVVAATEAVVCDLSLPNSGFLFVVPVSRAVGLQQRSYGGRR